MSAPTPLTLHLFAIREHATAAAARPGIKALVAQMQELGIECVVHNHLDSPPRDSFTEPAVYLTLGGASSDFPGLMGMDFADRRRWLHFPSPEAVKPEMALHCWLAATDPLPEPARIPPTSLPENPLVSVFTPAFRTGERLLRPLKSLLDQTYENWEWVIVDDSGDRAATFREWIAPLEDPRIVKVLLPERIGRIGSVKRIATDCCNGDILVELDHDDALTPDTLERIVSAFRRNPECGFAFAEAAEVYEDTGESHWYGWDAGFGYLTYWRQYDALTDRVLNVPSTTPLNARTVRHLVGLPNHPRAWTRAAYDAVGGHRRGLNVADDYDLLVRTFLSTRLLKIPRLTYLQYRNRGGENQTFVRNRQIQVLCAAIERAYRPRIDERLRSLGLPATESLPYSRIWTCPDSDPRWVSAEVLDQGEAPVESTLLVLPFDNPGNAQLLKSALDEATVAEWKGRELVAVGDVPEAELEAAARLAPPGALRWWRAERDWPLADFARYGRLLCSSKQRITPLGYDPSITASEPGGRSGFLSYVDQYALAGPRDKSRDRLHVLRWLQRQFGYRSYLEIGTDRDELFSQMDGFDLKVGVDPNAGGTHRMTSDDYFEANRRLPESERARFDLIFVDGLHEHRQILRDVDNALECLLPGGTIALHDCMPFMERHQIVPRPQPFSFWTGDGWKAIFELRQRPDIDIAVGRFDWGVAVLRVRPNSRPFKAPKGAWDWSYYETHREAGLNAMSFDELLNWVKKGTA